METSGLRACPGQEVERDTRHLLRQQASLARADRLAVLVDMAARMAHRLRSPLAGVLVALTNLRDETASPDHRERLRLSIEALQRSFRELSTLVDEASPEPEAPRPLCLHSIVEDLFLLVRHQVPDMVLDLRNDVAADWLCWLPEAGFRLALMHLIANAVESQRGRGRALVRIQARRGIGTLVLSILDKGPGFSAEALARARSPAVLWDHAGQGLGLALVRRFVDNLGGQLVLENNPHGGARTMLVMPQEGFDA